MSKVNFQKLIGNNFFYEEFKILTMYIKLLVSVDINAYVEISLLCRQIVFFFYDLFVWYINLEIKLDIVNNYYEGACGIIICNIAIK